MTRKRRYGLFIGMSFGLIALIWGGSMSQATATTHKSSLTLIKAYKTLPSRQTVATVNGLPITNRMIARFRAQSVYASQVSGRPTPSLTTSEVVHTLAGQLALYEAAKKMGIHVSNQQALTAAIQQERAIESAGLPISRHLKNLRQQLGESVTQYAQKYEEKPTKMLLTIAAARKQIEARVPQGTMTSAEWVHAQQQAVIKWQNTVTAQATIVMK